MSNPRLLISSVVAVGAVAIALWRVSALNSHEQREADTHRRDAQVIAASAESIFRDLEASAARIDEIGDSQQDWQRLFVRISARATGSLDRSSLIKDEDAVLAAAASFLYHRFINLDPSTYIAWRRDQGYRLRSVEELKQDYLLEWYETCLGHPPSDPPDSERMFRELIVTSDRLFEHSQVPMLLAIAPGSIGVAVTDCAHPSGADCYPRLEVGVGSDAWHGGTAMSFREWWAPPRTYFDLLEEHGTVRLATVGAILKYETGDWRSLVLFYHLDPKYETWFLVDVGQYNADKPGTVGAWDY